MYESETWFLMISNESRRLTRGKGKYCKGIFGPTIECNEWSKNQRRIKNVVQ